MADITFEAEGIGTDFAHNSNGRLYVIPQDPTTKEILLNVDRKTKEGVRVRHKAILGNDWVANTIANAYVEILIAALASDVKVRGNSEASISFYDLFTAYVTVRRNEEAEKEGNINIAFEPGKKALELISSTVPVDEIEYPYITPEAAYSFPNDAEYNEAFLKLDRLTKMSLQEKYNIIIPKDWLITATTYVFIETIFKELLIRLANLDKNTASVNFNDNIEIHMVAQTKNDEKFVNIMMRPGMSAKLLIKSDETTEIED